MRAARSRRSFRRKTNSAFLPQPKREAIRARGISAFVTVQEGCDKFCNLLLVVPYTPRHRSVAAGGQDHRTT